MEKIINLLKWFVSSKGWGRLTVEFKEGKIVNVEKTETLKV